MNTKVTLLSAYGLKSMLDISDSVMSKGLRSSFVCSSAKTGNTVLWHEYCAKRKRKYGAFVVPRSAAACVGGEELVWTYWRGAMAVLHPNPLGTGLLVHLMPWRTDRQL